MSKMNTTTLGIIIFISCVSCFNTCFAVENTGYKDLKFGMSEEQAQSTNIFNEGITLFGKKRSVEYQLDTNGKINKILLILGDYDQAIKDKMLKILPKKYSREYSPTKQDWVEYKKAVTFDDQVALMYAMYDESNNDTDLVGEAKSLQWVFENGFISLKIGKQIDPFKSSKNNPVFKDVLYVVYRNDDLAKYQITKIQKNLEINNRKTGTEDF